VIPNDPVKSRGGTRSESSNRFVRGLGADANVMFCAFFHSRRRIPGVASVIKMASSGREGVSTSSDPKLRMEHAQRLASPARLEAAKKAVSSSYATGADAYPARWSFDQDRMLALIQESLRRHRARVRADPAGRPYGMGS